MKKRNYTLFIVFWLCGQTLFAPIGNVMSGPLALAILLELRSERLLELAEARVVATEKAKVEAARAVISTTMDHTTQDESK